MSQGHDIYVDRIFNAATVSANGQTSSIVIDLNAFKPKEWTFSLHLITASAGAAVVDAEYLVSNDKNGNFVLPPGAEKIGEGHVVGEGIYQFTPSVRARYMQIRLTETAGVDVTSAIGDLMIQ